MIGGRAPGEGSRGNPARGPRAGSVLVFPPARPRPLIEQARKILGDLALDAQRGQETILTRGNSRTPIARIAPLEDTMTTDERLITEVLHRIACKEAASQNRYYINKADRSDPVGGLTPPAQELVHRGLITFDPGEPADERFRYYHVTPAGVALLDRDLLQAFLDKQRRWGNEYNRDAEEVLRFFGIAPVTADAVRDLYRDDYQAATLTRPDGTEVTKDDVTAAIDSYIEAGGEVDTHGEPAEWDVIAQQLAGDGAQQAAPTTPVITVEALRELHEAQPTDARLRNVPVLAVSDTERTAFLCHNPTPENNGWQVVYTGEDLAAYMGGEWGDDLAATLAEELTEEFRRGLR